MSSECERQRVRDQGRCLPCRGAHVPCRPQRTLHMLWLAVACARAARSDPDCAGRCRGQYAYDRQPILRLVSCIGMHAHTHERHRHLRALPPAPWPLLPGPCSLAPAPWPLLAPPSRPLLPRPNVTAGVRSKRGPARGRETPNAACETASRYRFRVPTRSEGSSASSSTVVICALARPPPQPQRTAQRLAARVSRQPQRGDARAVGVGSLLTGLCPSAS